MPNGKRKYPPLPGFDWEFPWEKLAQSWEAWQQQVGVKRAPEDEPGTFEYMMKQWQPAPPKYPAPVATMPWPEEARYPEGAKVGPFPAWGDFPYGGPEWGRYEIEKQPYVEQQRAALIRELEFYAEGLGESVATEREIWEQEPLAELQEILELYRQDWEQFVGRRAAEGGPGPGYRLPVGPQLRRVMQEAEELGVDTSWVERALQTPGYNEDLIIGTLGQRMITPRWQKELKERREFQEVQQSVKAAYPKEFAEIEKRISVPEPTYAGVTGDIGWGGIGSVPWELQLNIPMIEKDPAYQALKERYEWEISPEYATEKEREEAEAEWEREKAEAEWERMRRAEMGARGRWEIPRQW